MDSAGAWKIDFQDSPLTGYRLSAGSSAMSAGSSAVSTEVWNSPPCGPFCRCLGILMVWWLNSKSKSTKRARGKLHFLLWCDSEDTQHHTSAQILLHNMSVNLTLQEEHVVSDIVAAVYTTCHILSNHLDHSFWVCWNTKLTMVPLSLKDKFPTPSRGTEPWRV